LGAQCGLRQLKAQWVASCEPVIHHGAFMRVFSIKMNHRNPSQVFVARAQTLPRTLRTAVPTRFIGVIASIVCHLGIT